jgi:hypothetical protein
MASQGHAFAAEWSLEGCHGRLRPPPLDSVTLTGLMAVWPVDRSHSPVHGPVHPLRGAGGHR